MNGTFISVEGTLPLVISLPHVGTMLAPEIAARLTPAARAVSDTDWHVEQLYAFARANGAGWVQARWSRYMIDLNRPPDDASLYPGQTTSALCPLETFGGEALYTGSGPDSEEVAHRRERYWRPYHVELARLIAITKARFGHVVLLDAHSIASYMPRLFPGRLPDINVGTNDGRSCAPELTSDLLDCLRHQQRFSHVLNGRFKGGYITRHYGAPEAGVHAVQFEIGQEAYLEDPPEIFRPARAADLMVLLTQLVEALVRFRPAGVTR